MHHVIQLASSATLVSATEHAHQYQYSINVLLMSGVAAMAALQKLQCQRLELVLLVVLAVRFAVRAPLLGPDSEAARLISMPPKVSVPCSNRDASGRKPHQ